METILAIVAFVSLAMAIGMGLLVAKLLREERRRSDARVAALTELAAAPPADRPIPVAMRAEAPLRRAEPIRVTESRPAAAPLPRPVHVPPARVEPPTSRTAGRRMPSSTDDLEIRPAADDTAAPMFVKPERSSPWGARLAIIAPMAILIGIGLFGATVPFDSPLEDAAPPQAAAVATASHAASPLELLALRHAQQDGRFTVSGVVQNPRSGAALSRISATVAVFAADGSQVAIGRAALDFTTLAPGAESPFSIEVPVAQRVSRYRIGFRGEGGQVIEHVDRRSSADALAKR